jgi:hypothetical protein
VDDGALDHALEAGGRLGVVVVVGDERLELAVEVGGDAFFSAPGRRCTAFITVPPPCRRSATAEVLERGVLVAALVRVGDRAVQGLFEVL